MYVAQPPQALTFPFNDPQKDKMWTSINSGLGLDFPS